MSSPAIPDRWTAALALTALVALTGGFGLLVPRIHGLTGCGDYLSGRLLLCALIAFALAYVGLLARRATSPVGRLVSLSPVLFCASVVVNLAGGHDPLLAWLDWRAPFVDYASLTPGTETAGCLFIGNHEWISCDLGTGTYLAGRGA